MGDVFPTRVNIAINNNPQHDLAYINRGDAYSALGNNKEALEAFEKGQTINPNIIKEFKSQSVTLNALGNKQAAIRLFVTAIKIDFKDPEGYPENGNRISTLEDGEDFTKFFNNNDNIKKSNISSNLILYDQTGYENKLINNNMVEEIEMNNMTNIIDPSFEQAKNIKYSSYLNQSMEDHRSRVHYQDKYNISSEESKSRDGIIRPLGVNVHITFEYGNQAPVNLKGPPEEGSSTPAIYNHISSGTIAINSVVDQDCSINGEKISFNGGQSLLNNMPGLQRLSSQ